MVISKDERSENGPCDSRTLRLPAPPDRLPIRLKQHHGEIRGGEARHTRRPGRGRPRRPAGAPEGKRTRTGHCANRCGRAFLRERKALCLVGAPKSEVKHLQQRLAEKENWTQVQDGLEARVGRQPGLRRPAPSVARVPHQPPAAAGLVDPGGRGREAGDGGAGAAEVLGVGLVEQVVDPGGQAAPAGGAP